MKLLINKITQSEKQENLSHLSMSTTKKTPFGTSTSNIYMWVEDCTVKEGDSIDINPSDFEFIKKDAVIEDQERQLTYMKPRVSQ